MVAKQVCYPELLSGLDSLETGYSGVSGNLESARIEFLVSVSLKLYLSSIFVCSSHVPANMY